MSVQNWHEEFSEFWPKHSKISKICPLMGYLWPKYIIFELTKYRGVTFDDTENWCKIWRKTDMCFQKWHEEFGNLSLEHSKVSKLGLWWDPLIQSRKCMSLKFTGELCFTAMKDDVKFEEELTLSSKLTWRIWWILTRALKNYKNSHFNGLLCYWAECILFSSLNFAWVFSFYVST